MAEWQPIKTAPKDGTAILGWSEEMEEVMSIVWVDDRGGSWRISSCSSMELGSWGQPTHWMPLPAPPKDSGKTFEQWRAEQDEAHKGLPDALVRPEYEREKAAGFKSVSWADGYTEEELKAATSAA